MADDLRFHLTGFGPFQGVASNPTTVLCQALGQCPSSSSTDVPTDASTDASHTPPARLVSSATILETSAEACTVGLLDIIERAGARRPTRGTCFVHLGVSGRAEHFTLERTAWNEASFACPDERGFQPQRAPIAADDGPTAFSRQTRLPVQELARRLTARGFDTDVSDDPGRFVCNYLYYQSLRANTTEPLEPLEPRCANPEPTDGGKEGGGGGGHEDEEQHGGTNQGTNQDPHVLFVHVPPFERIPRDRQEAFVAALLSELRAVILHPAEGGKGGEGGEGGTEREGAEGGGSVDDAGVNAGAGGGAAAASGCAAAGEGEGGGGGEGGGASGDITQLPGRVRLDVHDGAVVPVLTRLPALTREQLQSAGCELLDSSADDDIVVYTKQYSQSEQAEQDGGLGHHRGYTIRSFFERFPELRRRQRRRQGRRRRQ